MARVGVPAVPAMTEKERFRKLLDSAPFMVWMSGPDKLFTYFNRPWLEFTGRSLDEEVEMGWMQGIHPEDVQGWMAAYERAFDSARPCRIEYRHRRYDGQYRWLLDQCMPRYEDGEFRGFTGYRIDGNQRKADAEAVQELSGLLINAQEDERARIARDLHDNVGQRVAMLAIDVELIKQGLAESDEVLRQQLDEVNRHTAELSRDIRNLSHQLHSAMLDHAGLPAAARQLCTQVSQQHGVAVEVTDLGVPRTLPRDISLCMFRILQESLNNVVKHSGARSAEVTLIAYDEVLELRIVDSGRGFDPEVRKSGLGLVSMKERLRLVGGKLTLRSAPDAGTEITAQVPLSKGMMPRLPRPDIAIGASYAQAARASGG